MAKQEQKTIKEVKAFAREVHVSPRKARPVARMIRNLPVEEALVQLRELVKKAGHPMEKLINSAIANASHNFAIPSSRLYIKNLTVDGGRVFLRYKPRAYGRALPVRKRTSHLNLILGVAPEPLVKKEKFVKAESKATTPSPPPPHEGEKKEGRSLERFKFWRKKIKKAEDTSQTAPKQDLKGKPYTSFDRRGNM